MENLNFCPLSQILRVNDNFHFMSKVNPITPDFSMGPFGNYLPMMINTEAFFLLPELSERIKRNKCFQWLINIILSDCQKRDKIGFAKWISHSLWINTQNGWLSTQEIVYKHPGKKNTFLMNMKVFAFAVHWHSVTDVQHWQIRMKNHKKLISSTYNELPLAETSEIISEQRSFQHSRVA